MTVIVVPYHQDERLGDDLLPLPVSGEFLVLAPDLPEGDLWTRLVALHDAAADQIAAALRTGAPTTVLSGDCLVAMGVLAGAQRAGTDPGVVWFDAHGDVHTLETTTSGYLGGLSLRLLLGAHPELLAGPLGVRPVPEDRAVLTGARDLDPPEADYLRDSAVRMRGVADLDPADLPDGPLILHVDGPPASDVVRAVHRVLGTGRVTVLDIACPWHPAANLHDQQARIELLRALISGQEPALKNR